MSFPVAEVQPYLYGKEFRALNSLIVKTICLILQCVSLLSLSGKLLRSGRLPACFGHKIIEKPSEIAKFLCKFPV